MLIDEWLYQIETSRGYGMDESMYEAIRKGPKHAENFFKGTIKDESQIVLKLHPPFKIDSWSPGAGFIPIMSTKRINQIKKGKL